MKKELLFSITKIILEDVWHTKQQSNCLHELTMQMDCDGRKSAVVCCECGAIIE